MAAKSIIVVDDSAVVRETLQAQLSQAAYEVRTAEGGAALRRALTEAPADLVIVDFQMPEEDGLSVTRYLRSTQACGIIMLTAKSQPADRVAGLDFGADDYLCKPYELTELLARIRSVLRRTEPAARQGADTDGARRYGAWAFDRQARALVGSDGETVRLTTAEFKLAAALTEQPGRVLTREALLGMIYDRPWDYFDRSIDVLVTRLRRKVERLAPGSDHIRAVRGAGYVFADASAPTSDAASPMRHGSGSGGL